MTPLEEKLRTKVPSITNAIKPFQIAHNYYSATQDTFNGVSIVSEIKKGVHYPMIQFSFATGLEEYYKFSFGISFFHSERFQNPEMKKIMDQTAEKTIITQVQPTKAYTQEMREKYGNVRKKGIRLFTQTLFQDELST